MEFPVISRVRSTNVSPTTSLASWSSRVVVRMPMKLKKWRYVAGKRVVDVRASLDRGGGDRGDRNSGGCWNTGTEVITYNNKSFSDADYPAWDNNGAGVRVTYGIEPTKFLLKKIHTRNITKSLCCMRLEESSPKNKKTSF
ncbi:hypothetical protein LXL04_026152 [Taraxacum kok-saghyz]